MIRQLADTLAHVDSDRPIWILPGQRVLNASWIRSQFHGLRVRWQDQLHDQRVCVHATSECELAPLLVLLDGVCRQLTLLPPSLSAKQKEQIVSRSGSTVAVCSGPPDFNTAGIEVHSVDVQSDPHSGPSANQQPQGSLPEATCSTRWVLPTSGTTGEPKLVAHTLASLTKTIKQDANGGEPFRWGTLYNVAGFAGLQVFLQAWCSGASLILSQRDAELRQRVEDLVAAHCTALSATPTMWRKLLMTCPVADLPLKQITLGGEIVDQAILDALGAAFPSARIVHIYASTEAGVGFTVRDRLAGFPARLLEQPPRGIRLSVSESGRLCIRSEQAEQRLLGSEDALCDEDGFIDTGDLVKREGDRYLFLGRANGTINVGGNKVHPEEIENFLLACTGVEQARVMAKPNPITGALVMAEVVPSAVFAHDASTLRTSLLAACRHQLDPYKVPAVLRVVSELETTSSGKLKRSN